MELVDLRLERVHGERQRVHEVFMHVLELLSGLPSGLPRIGGGGGSGSRGRGRDSVRAVARPFGVELLLLDAPQNSGLLLVVRVPQCATLLRGQRSLAVTKADDVLFAGELALERRVLGQQFRCVIGDWEL